MKSWIRIKDGAIVRRTNGPHTLSSGEGWQEVAYPANQWKLDATGQVIRKSQVELDMDAQAITETRLADLQRIGTKIEPALIALRNSGNVAPLTKILARIVYEIRSIEKDLS